MIARLRRMLPWLPARRKRASREPLQSTARGARVQVNRSAEFLEIVSELPKIDHAYGYAKVDGRDGVDRRNFEEYIRWSIEEERLSVLLDEAEQREKKLVQEEAEVRRLPATVAARKKQCESLSEHHKAAEHRLEALTSEIEAVEAERERTVRRGSIVFAVLYTTAGAAFVLGDLVMARAIVADALSLKGHKVFGLDESWLFAFGLAMLSVLLKPAYERLVEDIYHEKPACRRFRWTILVVSAFTLVTLAILGAFRSKSYQVNTLMGVSTQSEALQGLWTRLVNSPLVPLSFISSGVLFAVAGAICLGIGLRHAQDMYHLRFRLWRKFITLRADGKRVRAEMEESKRELRRNEAEVDRLAASAQFGPQHADVMVSLGEARDARLVLLESHRQARMRKLSSLYRDGYNAGHVGSTSEDAHERQRRPFLAVRRAIRLHAHQSYIVSTDEP